MEFLIGSYPRLGEEALIHRIDRLDDSTFAISENQAICINDLKAIRLHREDYEAIVQQQGVVDSMIKYWETV